MQYTQSPYNTTFKYRDSTYIYSSLTGALARVSHIHRFNEILSDEFVTINPECDLTKQLIKGMFLVPENYDVKATLKRSFMAHKFEGTTYSINISPTYGCNLDCTYCFERSWQDKELFMGFAEQRSIEKHIRQVLESGKYKRLIVVWTGGEPLLRSRWISELEGKLLDVCQDYDVKYTSRIITNMTLMNETVIEDISSMAVHSVQVTLDGYKNVHDKLRVSNTFANTFELILDNLERMVQQFDKIKYNLRIHVTKTTLPSIPLLVNELEERGLRNKVIISYARVRTGDDIEIPLQQYAPIEIDLYRDLIDRGWRIDLSQRLQPRASGCASYTTHSISITPDLSVFKCWEMVQDSKHCIGRIDDDGVLSGNGIENIAIALDPFTRDCCSECSVLPLCMGGCAKQEKAPEDSDATEEFVIGAKCYSIRYNLQETLRLHLYSLERGQRINDSVENESQDSPC